MKEPYQCFQTLLLRLAAATLVAVNSYSAVLATEIEEKPATTPRPAPSSGNGSSSSQEPSEPVPPSPDSTHADQTGAADTDKPPKQRPPIPEPPPATLLPPLSSFAKKPLSWRHKALKLSLDQYKVGKSITRHISTPAGKDAVLEALGRTIEEFGFRIESYSAPAGHVLAVSNADSAKLIFTVTPHGSTTHIRLLVDSAGQTCNSSFVDSFCERLEAAISKKELL